MKKQYIAPQMVVVEVAIYRKGLPVAMCCWQSFLFFFSIKMILFGGKEGVFREKKT